jgi:hypothetical protein
MLFTSPCKVNYDISDPAVKAATKGVNITQIDSLTSKNPIGPVQFAPVANLDAAVLSFTGAGTVFVRLAPVDLSGAEAAAPWYGIGNIGLPPVVGFSIVPGEAKWTSS